MGPELPMQGLFPLSAELRQDLAPLLTAFVFVFGACIGSFLNVVIWRLPRGESLSHPPSHCPRCNQAIRWWQNLPLVSWLALRARCFYCHQPISPRYPLVELVTALLFTAAWLGQLNAGLPWDALPRFLVLIAILVAAALIDADHGIIPNALTYFGMLVAVVTAVLFPDAFAYPGAAGRDPGNDAGVITGAVLSVAGTGRVWTAPGAVAGLTAILGIATGGGLLYAIRFIGNTLAGKRALPEMVRRPCAFSAAGLRLGDDAGKPENAIPKGFDSLVLLVRPLGGGETAAPVRVELFHDGILIDGRVPSAGASPDLTGVVAAAWARRETLGLGDVKLLAMTGAFLGPDACIWVLLVAALPALAAGGVLALPPFRRPAALVFGPFLAAAAILCFFFGNHLVLWYGRAILGLLYTANGL